MATCMLKERKIIIIKHYSQTKYLPLAKIIMNSWIIYAKDWTLLLILLQFNLLYYYFVAVADNSCMLNYYNYLYSLHWNTILLFIINFCCRSNSTGRRIDARGYSLLANNIYHSSEAANSLGRIIIRHLLQHPISICQVDRPIRSSPSRPRPCWRHVTVGIEVRFVYRTISAQQIPWRKLTKVRWRGWWPSLEVPQRDRDPTRWDERQPRAGWASPPRETQREVHYFEVASPVRDQNGQGLYIRWHYWVRETIT